MIRRRLRVEGVVQGIGFRPYVYRLARDLGLVGSVRNDSAGVEVLVQGEPAPVSAFVERLPLDLPPMGSISALTVEEVPPDEGATSFTIDGSDATGGRVVPITPDAHVCEDCLRELWDPSDRRYRYPFTNCTRCGPRFTIVLDVPYDRPRTTMRDFPMCDACRREYEDPADRRFHAQPVACPACGPTLRLAGPDGDEVEAAEPVVEARRRLLAGGIVAIKGIGGFHLAVPAGDETAVAELRRRKGRDGKPFAVMARDLDQARALARVGAEEAKLLESVPRPIVLLEARRSPLLCASVAPELTTVGVMLPSSPIHHLLLEEPMPPLVMTSGNPSDEPIVTGNDEALEVLGPLADALLVHDRGIQTGCDDSVAQILRGRSRMIRRSRGYVPRPIEVSGLAAPEPLLAVGGEQKVAICIARRSQLVMGRHLGDLTNARAHEGFLAEVAGLGRILGVAPAVVAHDLHPDYLSTRYALGLPEARLEAVQHHHAHMASCMAEHDLGLDERVVAVVLDGTGLGLDGTIWGGEVLAGGYGGFRRAAHLRAVRLPGGDRAIRCPYRTGLAYLLDALGPEALDLALPLTAAHDRTHLADLARMVEAGVSSPASSGAGRLFDAAAAIVGLPSALEGEITYDAQPAMELEALAGREGRAEPYPHRRDGDEIDLREAVRAMADDVVAGRDAALVAARLHETVAAAAVEAAARAAEAEGVGRVALSGGCFVNRRLSAAVEEGLGARGLEVLAHERVPPSDGGLALGQAAVACARLSKG